MSEKLTIEAFILCWNEEKMIRHTLNHYKTFCDKINIIDNCSSDNTLSILKNEYGIIPEYPELSNIRLKQFETNNQIRDDAYLHIKNTVWKNSTADFVIVCDMDELLYHENIISELKTAKKNGVGIIKTEGYNMFSNTFPEDYSKSITNQVKTGVRALNFDKSIIFSPEIIMEMLYSPGAHQCNPIYFPGKPKVNHLQTFKLLHYKYLSYDYLQKRHTMYANRLSNYNKKNNFGGEYLNSNHVAECFDAIKKSKLLKQII